MMSRKEEFMQYMLCGHGKCFSMMEQQSEEFRDIVLYGCLNDISFDLQCEGSRARFVYNLVLQYEDYDFFLERAILKFLSPSVNEDWRLMCHLCDLLDLFAYDSGDRSAGEAIEKKYRELYSLLMTLRWSARASAVAQSFEYVAIVIMQDGNFERTVQIFEDMGAYFLRCRHTQEQELRWRFEWFWSESREQYGDAFVDAQLAERERNSRKLRRFRRIMTTGCLPQTERSRKAITANEYIKMVDVGSITRKDAVAMRRASDSEKRKLAEAVLTEEAPEKKAELLKAFTLSDNPFPLDPLPLTEYARSTDEKLRAAARNALMYIKADRVHDLALELLDEGFSDTAVRMLLRNFADDDTKLLLDLLGQLTIDREDNSGWHGIIISLTEGSIITELPDELILLAYDKCMCSCCREDLVLELIKRNLFTDVIRAECLMDCNADIRSFAKDCAD